MFQKLALVTTLFLLPILGFAADSQETKMSNVSMLCQSDNGGFLALSSSENRLWVGTKPYTEGGMALEARDVSLIKNGPALDVYGLFEITIMDNGPHTTTVIGQIEPDTATTFVSVDLFDGKVTRAEPHVMNCQAL